VIGHYAQRYELKTWPEYFRPVVEGTKTAELRKDDRGFAVGGTLWMREWSPEDGRYTGREACAVITHIVRDTEHLAPGYAMLSFGRVTVWLTDAVSA
jgi:hypothetical protein